MTCSTASISLCSLACASTLFNNSSFCAAMCWTTITFASSSFPKSTNDSCFSLILAVEAFTNASSFSTSAVNSSFFASNSSCRDEFPAVSLFIFASSFSVSSSRASCALTAASVCARALEMNSSSRHATASSPPLMK
uniref:Pco120628 n=1 Tax=Arundo donax TaxID=35708 RepID=A0A0A8ZJ53_ARUDO